MFTKFFIEQFVPCEQPELACHIQRLPFEDPNSPVGLAHNAKAVRMIRGFKLSLKKGEVHIPDLNLVQSLAGEGVLPREVAEKDPERFRELEQFNALGALKPMSQGPPGQLTVIPVQQATLSLYDPQACTWFCMIPDKLELDLTNRCNLRCIHCSREAGPDIETQDELTPVELFYLVKQAAELGIPSLTLMGGEPTVHSYLFELAYYARHCGMGSISTSTNGLRVDEENARMMAALFSDVQVSLHGATAEVHDGIVGQQGAFAKATRAVRLLRQNGANDINVSFSVMHTNRDQMRQMIRLANEIGATSIRFLGLSPEGRGACLPQLGWSDRQQLSDVIRELREKERDKKLNIEGGGFPIYMPFNDEASFYGCPAGRTLMYVGATGLAGICSVLPERIANIRDQSLIEIWHHPTVRRFRQRINCDCPYDAVCAGGCLGAKDWAEKFPPLPREREAQG